MELRLHGKVNVFQQFRSTRGVTLEHKEGHFRITLYTLCSPEDIELAIHLAREIAASARRLVHLDYGEPFSADEWKQRLDTEAVLQSDAGLIERFLKREKEISIPGAIRPWHLGPRVMDRLCRGVEERPLHQRMIEEFRRVQWIHIDEDYTPVSKFQVGNDQTRTLAMWFPAARQILPHVKTIAVSHEEAVILVPSKCIPELARDRLRWLDERQMLIEAFDAVAVADILARAQEFEAD